MSAETIERLEQVRPGDLMLTTMSGAPAQVVVYGGQLLLGEFVAVGEFIVGHIGVVIEASRTLPPGTVQHIETGTYYGPETAWRDRPHGSYETYEHGVITAPKIVEAMPSGARVRELRVDRDWTPKTAFARLPEDYAGQAEKAAAVAELMVGTGYGFAAYPALAAWRFGVRPKRLEAYINRRGGPHGLPLEVICSQLADEAWTQAGKQVMPHGTKPQVVTPGGLAKRLLMRRGVIWGGGGL